MHRSALFSLLLLLITAAINAQQNSLVFTKGNKPEQRFWTGTEISFQSTDKYWHKGKIKKLTADSIYIQPVTVKYNLMGTDTISWPVEGYHLRDIAALPKRGYLISMINNQFQINRDAGHVHFYWIKSGVLFRVGAMAYTGVMLFNNLSDKNPDKTAIKKGLLTGAGIYMFGFLLKKIYSPVYKIGKRNKLKFVNYATTPAEKSVSPKPM
ncbi:MAG: hypothetical protein IPG86_13170 [Chitinophagaceae bacterium]|nr:hypothetical protein [Chitinophagaceae bacterium]